MRKTMRDPLPPLRPLSQGDDVDTPRGAIPKSVAAMNPRFSSDFEVNRSLFLTISPTTKSPLVQKQLKRILPPKTGKLLPDALQPLTTPSSAPRKHAKFLSPAENSNDSSIEDQEIAKIAEKVENEEEISSNEENEMPLVEAGSTYAAPELLEIQQLVQRLPDPDNPDFDIDNIYKISPALDRILSTVTDFSPKYISSLLNHPIIQDLWAHLFALIDVDDFLLRTIICRILLSFALDSSSPLLLPVSQIFYKLSCDQSNDIFFADESLHEILISIIRIASPEARVYAAGALRNIAANEEMREKLVSSDFLNLLEETINSENGPSTDLRLQLVSTARRLCKSKHFRKPLIERNIIQKLLNDKDLRSEGLKLAASIPDLPNDSKLLVMSFLMQGPENKADSDEESIKNRFLLNLGSGLENNESFLKLLMDMIRNNLAKNLEDQEMLARLLNEARKCIELPESKENAKKVFEKDDLFIQILNSANADARVSIPAYAVLKNLDGPNFTQAKIEFSMFDSVE